MAISQHLRRKLQEVLGSEAAADLLSQIEDMITLRADLNELRHEMQLGFARIDARFEKLEGQLATLIEKGLRDQTRFFFLAWSVLLAAIVGLLRALMTRERIR
jgi:hypothetical protein